MAKKTSIIDPVTEYARATLKGKHSACHLVKLACQRHLDDLKRKEFYFDAEEANRCFRFLSYLYQWKGEFAGEPLVLHPSQQFIIGSLIGWKRSKDGLRRFRVGYIELPRKNGKSTLAAGMALYMLMMDGEQGAECYAVATKEDQAKIVWRCAWEMYRRNPELRRHLKKTTKAIAFHRASSTFVPLGSDSDTQDGLNPSFAVFDELHKWKRRDLWTVIEEGMGSRRQPLIMVITTAGNNTHSICYQQRLHVERILTQKRYNDDTYFAYCSGIDKADEETGWMKKTAWAKANPLLGVSKKERFMADKCALAKQVDVEKDTFLQFHCNVWIRAAKRWLNVEQWDQLADPDWPDKEYDVRPCFVGVDLSSHKDLTAVVWIFPPEGERDYVFFWPRFFMPEARIIERTHADKVPFDDWEEQGWLQKVWGETMDYDDVRYDISEQRSMFPIRSLGIDPWNAAGIGPKLIEDDIDVVNVRQGYATLNRPCKEFESMILDKKCRHDGNPIMSWCVDNVVASMDAAGNLKPDKAKSSDVKGATTKRIDGVTALLTGLALYLEEAEKLGPELTFINLRGE